MPGPLDARRRAAPPPSDVRYGWPLRLAALVTVLTYVVTGHRQAPLRGRRLAVGRHPAAPDHLRQRPQEGARAARTPPSRARWPTTRRWSARSASLTLLVELSAPVALLGRRWATAWVAAAWLFHAGIVALMAITFPYPLSLVAFAPLFRCERPFQAIARWRAVVSGARG